jgi:signal recognition particle subunit SRP54
MLEVLSNGFNKARDRLRGKIELTAENIEEALKDIRLSLLEADVQYSVVKTFISQVQEKALGEVVDTRVTHRDRRLKVSPGDHFINICHEELINLMGPVETGLSFGSRPVSAVMLLGLQGCGKTTTAGKLARHLAKNNRKPLLVAADIYRPAAVQQLKVIGESLNLPVFSAENTSPPDICSRALLHAREIGCDIAIFDTAGRLAIDEPLMQELHDIAAATKPENIFLVCDAMIGQDAVNTAETFSRRLDVTGFIMTKLDGDARGGAALSIKQVTGRPIKFLGMGEGLENLEEFRPEGLASRILGFGDVVGLMKDFEEVVDEKKAEEDAQRLLKGKFTLIDFLEQIQTLKKMGPLQDLVEKIPFFKQMTGNAAIDDTQMVRVESIINSMTPGERTQPDVLNESRKRRIASGCGRTVKDVNDLLKRFKQMRDMMKNMSKSGLLGKLASGFGKIPGMGDMLPGGMPDADALSLSAMKAPRQLSAADRKKQKNKRKQARQSRKKSRR